MLLLLHVVIKYVQCTPLLLDIESEMRYVSSNDVVVTWWENYETTHKVYLKSIAPRLIIGEFCHAFVYFFCGTGPSYIGHLYN